MIVENARRRVNATCRTGVTAHKFSYRGVFSYGTRKGINVRQTVPVHLEMDRYYLSILNGQVDLQG